MKLAPLSDLHFEFRDHLLHDEFIQTFADPNEVDVLILAGDITTATSTKEPIKKICAKYKNVLMVMGNHDYYKCFTPEHARKKVRELQQEYPNFHLLEDNVVEIDGRRFVGSTLWFAYADDNVLYKNQLNDFRQIRNLDPWVYQQYAKSVHFLKKNIQKGDVVITHHLPSYSLVEARYQGDEFNRFFANNLDSIIHENEPSHWFMGHSHGSIDLTIGNTRCIRNPYGYFEHEENKSFNSKLIIEI